MTDKKDELLPHELHSLNRTVEPIVFASDRHPVESVRSSLRSRRLVVGEPTGVKAFLEVILYVERVRMPVGKSLRMRFRAIGRRRREVRMFASAMHQRARPVLAQIIPIRRCNLACSYCNEFDHASEPVPLSEMVARVDKLAALGVSVVTISGGEPLLHPQLETIISRIRQHGAIATLISNAYLLSPQRIHSLNDAGLDYLQISIDNVEPDDTSKKSLRVLDRKLEWLAREAEFSVTINSVLGVAVTNPEDALTVARRARSLGFNSTVGIAHDGAGQSRGLPLNQFSIYQEIRRLETGVFSFAHYDRFQENLVRGLPNAWHCHAGARFLYICEDGRVHWCSQQRGHPGIPLVDYKHEDIEQQYAIIKECAPFCGISCVQQVAMLDEIRENPGGMLQELINRRRATNPNFRAPILLRSIAWAFLDNPYAGTLQKAFVRLLGLNSG
jgi:MoaA/NifB/PqqE/SkfB family radical SAM enzyme